MVSMIPDFQKVCSEPIPRQSIYAAGHATLLTRSASVTHYSHVVPRLRVLKAFSCHTSVVREVGMNLISVHRPL